MLSDTGSKDAVYLWVNLKTSTRNLLRSKEDVSDRVEHQPLELHTNECLCFYFSFAQTAGTERSSRLEGLAFSMANFAMKRFVRKRQCRARQLCMDNAFSYRCFDE